MTTIEQPATDTPARTRADWLAVVEEIGPGFAAGAGKRDDADQFVADHYPVLKERGIISALVPADLGGGGASHSTMGAIIRRLGYYDPSTALALSMHQHLVGFQAFNHRNGRPAPVLPRVAAERLVLVSTGARDWLESNGSMTRVEGGFHVSARKAFASGSPAGNVLVTSAPYEDPEAGWQVLHFAVPMSAPGVSLGSDWQVHGMRSTGSQSVLLEDVFVPDAAVSLRRPRGEYHGVWDVIITVALPLIAGAYVGIADRASEVALGLLKDGGRDPVVQMTVGEMRSALVLARNAHDRMLALANDLDFTPSLELTDEILVLKTHAVASARTTVERAIEAVGGRGYYRNAGLERLLRDVRAGDYHPLPAKQQVRFSGRAALALPPIEVPAP
ncbi:MAG: acyl-CoA dehydrogenase [Dehalococcoidia bacterium]|nr:acyl-CoA dehydrogenase [Dehalococcoidia bacterium]